MCQCCFEQKMTEAVIMPGVFLHGEWSIMSTLTYGSIIFEARFSENRKLHELFHTEYGISFIRKECVFTCRYRQYYGRKSRTMVVNFFFLIFLEKRPLSIFLMVWIHSTYFQRDLPTNLGVLEEARRSSLSAVTR